MQNITVFNNKFMISQFCFTDESNSSTGAKKKSKVKYDKHGYPIYKDWEPTPATEAEKAILRQEFLTHMHQRFLSGQEKDNFDYSNVDFNAEYDSVDIRTQDEEERYFDDESPEDVGSDDGDGGGNQTRQDEGEEDELEEWETFGNDQLEETKTGAEQNETPMER